MSSTAESDEAAEETHPANKSETDAEVDVGVDAENDSAADLVVDSESDDTAVVHGYRLTQFDVYNWGPFSGRHTIDFDDFGTAIIGPTGSGKTTLVDALMTLLVEHPKYNLASTGGHESDRTLVSYVRGVLGGDADESGEAVARPGKTMTAVGATYQLSDDDVDLPHTVRLVALLWTDGASSSQSDLKRRWVFCTNDEFDFDTLLKRLHDDGVRQLMKDGRETTGLRINESKRQYLAGIRKFFDVSENAFTLLNRAAGLKQLNSIDEIFRQLVLDDHAAFDRALEVATEFDTLAEIHTELVIARKQIESLRPVESNERERQKLDKKTRDLQNLRRIMPIWFAQQAQRLWTQRRQQLQIDLTTAQQQRDELEHNVSVCEVAVKDLFRAYNDSGGGDIDNLNRTIELVQERLQEREKNVADYQHLVGQFNLPTEASAESLRENQSKLKTQRDSVQSNRDKHYADTLATSGRIQQLQTQQKQIEDDVNEVRQRPNSNLPRQQQEFRDSLASHLNVDAASLPFLAELVEVKSDESDWRGAIERAIGADRMRVLVPAGAMRTSLAWVNDRDNRLHVRLQSVDDQVRSGGFFDDSYAHKLNFRDHAFADMAR
ncbi:MAG: ATP-binding protein, partial [Planctomycetota bacterium]